MGCFSKKHFKIPIFSRQHYSTLRLFIYTLYAYKKMQRLYSNTKNVNESPTKNINESIGENTFTPNALIGR